MIGITARPATTSTHTHMQPPSHRHVNTSGRILRKRMIRPEDHQRLHDSHDSIWEGCLALDHRNIISPRDGLENAILRGLPLSNRGNRPPHPAPIRWYCHGPTTDRRSPPPERTPGTPAGKDHHLPDGHRCFLNEGPAHFAVRSFSSRPPGSVCRADHAQDHRNRTGSHVGDFYHQNPFHHQATSYKKAHHFYLAKERYVYKQKCPKNQRVDCS